MPFEKPLAIRSFPRAILHIDGDAFFASCEQARNPRLKGRPVITGKERGIVSSMSYEAKARGVARAMKLHDAQRMCPDVVILPSDYETYSLLSMRFFSVVRRYTPDVEEYGIDECFADLTGMRGPLHMSYPQIAERIKNELETELGFTFSLGLAPNKVIAKIGSKWNKPSGLVVIPGREIHTYLQQLPVERVWGIGRQTMVFLNKHGMFTALDFARMSEDWIVRTMSKPFYEIWQELNGRFIFSLETKPKRTYQSIQKMKTFVPPSNDPKWLFAQLSKNIENACIKARRYGLAAPAAFVFLRTQSFDDTGVEAEFSRPTAFPHEIINAVEPVFRELFHPRRMYRSTGVVLLKLREHANAQLDLFGESLRVEKASRLYDSVDRLSAKYGKHALYIGASHDAYIRPTYKGQRADETERKKRLLPGETKRKRLAVPMLMGEVE